MKRIKLILCLLCIMSLTIGGCVGFAAPAKTVAKKPVVGGKMVWAMDSGPTNLDPQITTNGNFVTILTGGSVMFINAKGKYVPYLAESYTSSEDGLVKTIVFKKNLKWSDGTSFNSSDYVWTITRASKNRGSRSLLSGFKSVEAVDDRTVKITFSRPNAALNAGLSQPTLQPQCKAYYDKVGDVEFARKPMGLGPYKFKEWVVGTRIVLERNPYFKWAPEGRPAPYISTLEFRFITQTATKILAFNNGDIDMCTLTGKNVADYEKFIKGDSRFKIISGAGVGFGNALLMNLSKAPFTDIKVRQAINYALNRESLVKLLNSTTKDILYGPLRSGTFGYSSTVTKLGYKYNLAKATALIKEAGYTKNSAGKWAKDGQVLKMTIKTTSIWEKESAIVQQQLTNFGIAADIQQAEFSVFLDDLTSGKYDVAVYGASWDDATILFGFFHSMTLGASNYSQLSDPVLDKMTMNIYTAANADVLKKNAADAQNYMVEKAYIAPLYSPSARNAISTRIKGFTPTFKGSIDMFGAYINSK